MSQIPLVDLQTQYKNIAEEVLEGIREVLETSSFINGPAVHQFAHNLQQYLNVAEVIPCANGTDALQIALMALDLQPGDEVITTPFTFVATAEVIALLQLKPVFVDVNPCTFVINEYQIEKAITPRTRAIIPVHLFGQGANMEAIMKMAQKHQLYVIEDNAQAIGADFLFSDGTRKKLGTIGHIGCTSFFPSKNLGGYGDGGALFTQDEALANRIRVIANHGSERRYYHDQIGVNSRLDSLQAAILNVKLKHLDSYNKARQQAAQYYSTNLGDLKGIQIPREASYSTHVFHQYTLLVHRNRDFLQQYLTEKGVSSAIYYPVPLHLQAAYSHYGYGPGDFPVSEELASKVLSLPMHSELSEDTLKKIVETIQEGIQAAPSA